MSRRSRARLLVSFVEFASVKAVMRDEPHPGVEEFFVGSADARAVSVVLDDVVDGQDVQAVSHDATSQLFCTERLEPNTVAGARTARRSSRWRFPCVSAPLLLLPLRLWPSRCRSLWLTARSMSSPARRAPRTVLGRRWRIWRSSTMSTESGIWVGCST